MTETTGFEGSTLTALMTEAQDYRHSIQRAAWSRTHGDRPRTFTLRGHRWDLLDTVFAPTHSPSTNITLDLLDTTEAGELTRPGPFLEMGCGTGVLSVLAALGGNGPVVACDVNPAAVENTRLNARRHGVEDRLHATRSDLFGGLPPEQRFMTIFFSSNYVHAPADYRYRNLHEQAYVDPGYAIHRRYLAEAPRWLAPGGSALLHFSSRGDTHGLHRIADEVGSELRTVRRITVLEKTLEIEHMLIEITAR